MCQLEDYAGWEIQHEFAITTDLEAQYDVFDVIAEQEYLRSLGATERDLRAYGRVMMELVEVMRGYTDMYEYKGLGHD